MNLQLKFLELETLFLCVTTYFSYKFAQLFSKLSAAPESYGKKPQSPTKDQIKNHVFQF